jgi:hypothetical protein
MNGNRKWKENLALFSKKFTVGGDPCMIPFKGGE